MAIDYLINRFGERVVYDAVSNTNARVCEYNNEGDWSFPRPFIVLQLIVNNLPRLYNSGSDYVVWNLHPDGQYSNALAKKSIRDHKDVVDWWRIVWFKGCAPKQSFIMRMACRRKLLTRDKQKKWGCVNEDSCVLCNNGVESIDHLFFQCKYTNKIWEHS